MCNIKSGDGTLLPSGSEENEEEIGDSTESSDSDEDMDSSSVSSDVEDDLEEEEEEDEQAEEEEENSLFHALENKDIIEQRKQVPPQISCDDLVVDISFHPRSNVLAAASVTGDLILYKYDLESVTVADTLEVHTKACRAVEYSENGDLLFSASKDRSIMISDSRTGKLKEFYDKAHDGALYSLTVVSEHIFATGDEDGVIKLWDVRHKDPIFSLTDVVKDYVSCMVTNYKKRYLACISGDGTVTAINIPSRKVYAQSEAYDSDYTCASLCKEDKKLVVGTGNGRLVIYNWGEFGLHNDMYSGSMRKAINCQVAISDNIVITGWEDGVIRAAYLFPSISLGVVGQHTLSVDALDLSHDGEYVASCSLDQKINFWRVSYFNELDYSSVTKESGTNLPSSLYKDRKSFFSDLE